MAYDAFISYSQRTDNDLAKAVRRGMHGLARPRNRLRAVSVFLDTASLELSPELAETLRHRLDACEWLILFLSEDSAGSEWVDFEVREWLRTKTRDRMLLVLTSGEIVWDDAQRDFDYAASTAIPDSFRDVYAGQSSPPSYLDMRWTKKLVDGESTLRLGDTRFRDQIATLSAPIRDVPKDELEGEDVRQHRRGRRLRRAAVSGLAVLTAVAIVAFLVALQQRSNAIREQNLARAGELAALSAFYLDSDPELAALLAVESSEVADDPTAASQALQSLIAHPWQGTLAGHTGDVLMAQHSPDGTRIATMGGSDVRIWDTHGNLLAVLDGHRGSLRSFAFDPSGTRVVTASIDETARIWDIDGAPLASPLQHGGPVNTAEFSPDGTRVLTASSDDTARIWDTGGNLVATLTGHEAGVVSARFSADGSHIVTASNDRTPRIWTADGALRAVLAGHTVPPEAVQRESRSPEILASLAAFRALLGSSPRLTISFARFDETGLRVITTGDDDVARLWDLDGTSLATLEGHDGDINGASFAPDGKLIVTASSDHTTRIWDTAGNLVATLKGHSGRVNSAKFSSDGATIVTAGADGTARLWDLDGNLLSTLAAHDDTVNSAEFSPAGTRILTGSDDGTAKLWATGGALLGALPVPATGEPCEPATVPLPNDFGFALVPDSCPTPRFSAEISPDGTRILTAGTDDAARIYDLGGRLRAKLQSDFGDPASVDIVTAAHFSEDGARVVTVSSDKRARIWHADGTLLAVLEGHAGEVHSAAFDTTGDFVLTASEDNTARLWNAGGDLIAELDGHGETVATIPTPTLGDGFPERIFEPRPFIGVHGVVTALFEPGGTRILTASGSDGTARLWDLDGDQLAAMPSRPPLLTAISDMEGAWFSPNGALIATLDGSTLRIWTTDGDLRGSLGGVATVAFAPDGSRLVTTRGNRNSARIVDTTGRRIATLIGHRGQVNSAHFSPDGTRIVTAGADGTTRVWDTEGNQLYSFAVDSQAATGVRSAVISPTSDHIVTVSTDDTVRVWRWSEAGDALIEVRRRLGERGFSAAECTEFRIDPCPEG